MTAASSSHDLSQLSPGALAEREVVLHEMAKSLEVQYQCLVNVSELEAELARREKLLRAPPTNAGPEERERATDRLMQMRIVLGFRL